MTASDQPTTIDAAMADDVAVPLIKIGGPWGSGWQKCSVEELWDMLRYHVTKGDPVDVANLAMMIYHNSRNDT